MSRENDDSQAVVKQPVIIVSTEHSLKSNSPKKKDEDLQQQIDFDVKGHYNNDFGSKEVRIRKIGTSAHKKVKNHSTERHIQFS